MRDEIELQIEVTEDWGSTAIYSIFTDGSEIYGGYSSRSQEWMRSVTAELSEDDSLLVVKAVVELDELPGNSYYE